jgi:predicted nuclease of predicted toxin-antitoxin system
MSNIRFLFDVHVHSAITKGLRRRGVEVLTCQEAQIDTASDEAIVQFVLLNDWVIFSQDSDFLKICSQQFPHKGLVYTHKQNDIGRIIQGLMLISEILSKSDMEDHIEFI